MASIVARLERKGLLPTPPKFLAGGMQYEVITGSVAYGVDQGSSDLDIYGFCTPPKDYVFHHLRGEIAGFSTPGPRFDQYQQHHLQDADALGGRGREYDLAVYSIIKYFRLCMENNPNMIDSLFVPARCVLYSTKVGDMVRDQRRLFLHKGAWPRFKGYAYAQMHKIHTKNPQGKRKELVDRYGYDVKFAYHVVRLLNEVEQILTESDLDLDLHSEQLKAIRRGEWPLSRLEEYFHSKERELEAVYSSSKLRQKADESALQGLLLQCLEQCYGDLSRCVVREDDAVRALRDIDQVLGRVRGLL